MNQTTMKKLFILCLLLAVGISLQAQQQLTITVTDTRHAPIDAASVLIENDSRTRLLSNCITNEQGLASVSIPSGAYLLSVRCLGYREQSRTITVTSADMSIDIVLESDVTTLNDVVVTARKQRPVAKMVAGKVQIDVAQSYLSNVGSALDVLKNSPGVRVSNDGSIALSSLGGTSVYVNGKKIRLQGEALTAYLRSLSSAHIEQITTSATPDAGKESDGGGGIIEITLKDNTAAGLHIDTSHGITAWHHLRTISDFALAYNRNNWQIGANYHHAIGHYGMTYGFDRVQDGNRNYSNTQDVDKRNSFAADVNLVYEPAKAHRFAADVSLNALVGQGITRTESDIYTGETTLNEILRAENDYVKQQNLRYSTTLSYRYSPDAAHTLNTSLDFIHVDGNSTCHQPNARFTPGNSLKSRDFYVSEPRQHINIWAFTSDYHHRFSRFHALSTGIKLATVAGKNAFGFTANGTFDLNRANRFDYRESNAEAYLQYTASLDKWTLAAGLRLEDMYTDTRLRPYAPSASQEHHYKNRLQLFPNLSATYQAGKNTQLTLSYSKRQDKPRYEQLNPFEYLLDELTYWKGNPFIAPQYNHKVTLGFSARKWGVSLGYNHLNNYFTEFKEPYGTGTIVLTTKNIGKAHQLSCELFHTRRIAAWWDISANVGGYYLVKALDQGVFQHTYRRASWMLALSNDIQLPGKIRFELSAQYNSKRQGNAYEVLKPSGYVNVSFNKTFLKKTLALSLLMTDVLHTERWDNVGNIPNLRIATWGNSETRAVTLRVRYNIGVQKYDTRKNTISEVERL